MPVLDVDTARQLRNRGFHWQPQPGDRYLSGITGLPCTYDGLAVHHDDLFLPRLHDLLEWVRQQGYDYQVQRNDISRRTWAEPAEYRVDLGYPARTAHTPFFYGNTLAGAAAAAVLWLLGQR